MCSETVTASMPNTDMCALKWNYFHKQYGLGCLLVFLAVLPISVTSEQSCVEIYPTGDVFIRIGDPLELLCKTNGEYSSHELVFIHRGIIQNESNVVNDTTLKLFTYPKRYLNYNYLAYYCKIKKKIRQTKCTDTIATKMVYISLPPQKVENFKCISHNFEFLNCSWNSRDDINTDYRTTYFVEGGTVRYIDATAVPGSKIRYFVLNVATKPRYRTELSDYIFHIESHNMLGTNHENISLPDHLSIVKPAPLVLTVVKQSPREVTLQGQFHNNLVTLTVLMIPDAFDHRIECEYMTKSNTIKHFKTYNFKTAFPIPENVTFKLTDLYAHTQYKVRVYTKPSRASDEYWSDPSEANFTTSSEIPRRPPDIPTGSFHQIAFQNQRQLYIYWKQLEENEEAATNFNYNIRVEYSKVKSYFNTTLGNIKIDVPLGENIDVYTWAANDVGRSVNASHLHIPTDIKVNSLRVSSFTKHAYGNGTYRLSWLGLDNVDNYTLLWCPYVIKKQCTDRINFTNVAGTENNYFVDLPTERIYQFAISANYRDISSGIAWTVCETDKDITLSDFAVNFKDFSDIQKTSVKLHWSLDCILEEGYLLGYNITYCPENTPRCNCESNYKYVSNPEQHTLEVSNLKPYTEYNFTMGLHIRQGIKIIDKRAIVRTLADTPSIPRNIRISNISQDSLVVNFDPPVPLNGKESDIKYEVFNTFGLTNEKQLLNSSYKSPAIVTHLLSFTDYSLSIRACNIKIKSCSNNTREIFVRTRIGKSSRLDKPIAEKIKDNTYLFKWKQPTLAGGNVDAYQVKFIKDEREEKIDVGKNNEFVFDSCEKRVDIVGFRVRTVNNDSDIHYGALGDTNVVDLPVRRHDEFTLFYGDWSEEISVPCRKPSDLTVIYVIAGALGIVLISYAVRKYYLIDKAKRDIYPVFAPGLFPEDKSPPAPSRSNKTIFQTSWFFKSSKKSRLQRGNEFNHQTSVDSTNPLILPDDIVKEHLLSTNIKTNTSNLNESNKLASVPEDNETLIATKTSIGPNDILSKGLKNSKPVDKVSKAEPVNENRVNDVTENILTLNKLEKVQNQINLKENAVTRKPTFDLNPGYVPVVKDIINKPVKNANTGYVQAVVIPTDKETTNEPIFSSNTGYISVPDAQAVLASPHYVKAREIELPDLQTVPTVSSQSEAKPISGYVCLEDANKIYKDGKFRPTNSHCIRITTPKHKWHSKTSINENDILKNKAINHKEKQLTANTMSVKLSNGYVKPEDVINKQLNIMSRSEPDVSEMSHGYCRLSLNLND